MFLFLLPHGKNELTAGWTLLSIKVIYVIVHSYFEFCDVRQIPVYHPYFKTKRNISEQYLGIHSWIEMPYLVMKLVVFKDKM